MHGIKVLMAKNYIDNLSEEARKGMREKAEQGLWPTFAPLGYRNVLAPNGKRVIEPDPELAPLIRGLFESYAHGTQSIKEAAQEARSAGLTFRKSGSRIPTSTVHKMLRTRLYMGEFDWNGRIYPGTHAPIVPRDLWDRVQATLDGRKAKRGTAAPSTTLHSLDSSNAATAVAPSSGRSRSSGTSTTTARATAVNAGSPTSARRSSNRSSPTCSAGLRSMTKSSHGSAML